MNPIIKILNDLIYQGFEYFGKYYSKYGGFCVDNRDPENWARIKVVVPGIIETESQDWAIGANQFSGEGYGARVLPRIGDMVWVEFLHGNPNKPVWSFGHFGQNEIPKELQNPEIYWFKTPAGHLVELDDTEKKEEIRITDIFNNKIVLDKQGISLVIGDGKTKIFLGDLDKADEPAVLGDKLEAIVKAHNGGLLGAMKSIKNISSNFSSLATKMAGATTPVGLITVLGTTVPGIIDSLKTDGEDLEKSNKSIAGLDKTIPGIKSSKVRLK